MYPQPQSDSASPGAAESPQSTYVPRKKGAKTIEIIAVIVIVIAAIGALVYFGSTSGKHTGTTTIPSGPINGTTTISQSGPTIPTPSYVYLYYLGAGNATAISSSLSAQNITLQYRSGSINASYNPSDGYTYLPVTNDTVEVLRNGSVVGSVPLKLASSMVGEVYDNVTGDTYFVSCLTSTNSYYAFVLSDNALLYTVQLPACPTGQLAYNSQNGDVYVATFADSSGVPHVVTLDKGQIAGELNFNGTPVSVFYDSVNHYLYVSTVANTSHTYIYSGTSLAGSLPIAMFGITENTQNGYVYGGVVGLGSSVEMVNGTTDLGRTFVSGGLLLQVRYNYVANATYALTTHGISEIKGTGVVGNVTVSGSTLSYIGSDPSNGYIYLFFASPSSTTGTSGSIYVIKGSSVETTIPANFTTSSVLFAYNPKNSYMYITGGGTLYVVNGANLVKTLPVGGYTSAMSVGN